MLKELNSNEMEMVSGGNSPAVFMTNEDHFEAAADLSAAGTTIAVVGRNPAAVAVGGALSLLGAFHYFAGRLGFGRSPSGGGGGGGCVPTEEHGCIKPH